MVQELLDLQEILQYEDYGVCEISYMQMSVRCKKFDTRLTIEFRRGDGVQWDKDTYVITSSDGFQSIFVTTIGEVMNILFLVRHSIGMRK